MTIGLINALPMVPEIHVVSPGPGPWAVGSQQIISWWASGILGNRSPYAQVEKRYVRRADQTTTAPTESPTPSETGESRTLDELPDIPSNWKGQISNQAEKFFNNERPQNNGRPESPQSSDGPPRSRNN
ncbi:12019_t:CDS:2 [Cetraspora pellucida]|uniref:12019_t:CDS:1 n=1 Tax=Cetraspora pellucida TaxID=1433469 RepID=A0ACA9K1D4_9GLOM|nr:12019_t:CDS:2 [Cetraspora pellucida]